MFDQQRYSLTADIGKACRFPPCRVCHLLFRFCICLSIYLSIWVSFHPSIPKSINFITHVWITLAIQFLQLFTEIISIFYNTLSAYVSHISVNTQILPRADSSLRNGEMPYTSLGLIDFLKHSRCLTIKIHYHCVRRSYSKQQATYVFLNGTCIQSKMWSTRQCITQSNLWKSAVPLGYWIAYGVHTTSPCDNTNMILIYPVLHSGHWMYGETWSSHASRNHFRNIPKLQYDGTDDGIL